MLAYFFCVKRRGQVSRFSVRVCFAPPRGRLAYSLRSAPWRQLFRHQEERWRRCDQRRSCYVATHPQVSVVHPYLFCWLPRVAAFPRFPSLHPYAPSGFPSPPLSCLSGFVVFFTLRHSLQDLFRWSPFRTVSPPTTTTTVQFILPSFQEIVYVRECKLAYDDGAETMTSPHTCPRPSPPPSILCFHCR